MDKGGSFLNLTTKARAFFQPGEMRRRLAMTFVGVVLCAVSGGIMKRAGFGGDPFQMLCNGLDNVLPIDFGTIHVLLSVIMLAAILRLDKHFIGVATVFNLFFTGYIVDWTYRGLGVWFPNPGMALRIGMLAFSLVLMCLSASLYFTSDMGVSTYDFVALYISKIQKRIPFRFVRISTDAICVIAGLFMGSVPGVGTLITACFMGPLISFFDHAVSEPLRYGKGKK